jgi:hypothetical protein
MPCLFAVRSAAAQYTALLEATGILTFTGMRMCNEFRAILDHLPVLPSATTLLCSAPQAAKPCAMPASADNVKSTDNHGRKWGWENGASCAFKVSALSLVVGVSGAGVCRKPVPAMHARDATVAVAGNMPSELIGTACVCQYMIHTTMLCEPHS